MWGHAQFGRLQRVDCLPSRLNSVFGAEHVSFLTELRPLKTPVVSRRLVSCRSFQVKKAVMMRLSLRRSEDFLRIGSTTQRGTGFFASRSGGQSTVCNSSMKLPEQARQHNKCPSLKNTHTQLLLFVTDLYRVCIDWRVSTSS